MQILRWAKKNYYADGCDICKENIITISVQYFSKSMNLQEILHCNVWTIEAIL